MWRSNVADGNQTILNSHENASCEWPVRGAKKVVAWLFPFGYERYFNMTAHDRTALGSLQRGRKAIPWASDGRHGPTRDAAVD